MGIVLLINARDCLACLCEPGPSGVGLSQRDVGSHRVISMLAWLPPLIADDPIYQSFDWREAMNIVTYKLTQLHQKLDEQIRTETRRRAPDSLTLLRLKRLRLRVKDRLYARQQPA